MRRWEWPILVLLIAAIPFAYYAAAFPEPPHEVPTPTLELDPLAYTATSIVRGVTSTAEALKEAGITPSPTIYPVSRTPQPSTPFPQTQNLLQIDDLALTATAIVGRATNVAAEALLPTSTPRSTLTATEEETLRLRWLTELETAAGFSDPQFTLFVDALIIEAQELIERDNRELGYRDDWSTRIRRFSTRPEVATITVDGVTYVAIVAERSILLRSYTLMLFRVVDGHVELVPIPIQDELDGYILAVETDPNTTGDTFRAGTLGFADRNSNGFPDLAIGWHCGGNSRCHRVYLIELQGSTVIDLMPDTGDLRPRELVDLDADGIMEIEADSYFYGVRFPGLPTSAMPLVTRYYGWDSASNAYHDISATVDESHWSAINAFWQEVAQDEGCIPTFDAYAPLLNYLAMDRLTEGWALVEPHLHWEKCEPRMKEQYSTEMVDLVAWVESQLEAAQPM
jgi:hypothetical protein